MSSASSVKMRHGHLSSVVARSAGLDRRAGCLNDQPRDARAANQKPSAAV